MRSLLSLKASLLKHTQNHNSINPNIPKFLEEDTTEMSEKTVDLMVLNSIFPLIIVQIIYF